ncbi:MAG: TetR/AcrR family transcriptional regulator [Natronospirillum sp.]
MARASKRDHIVEQATALFLDQGFKGTSVDSVITACAVSKPTVYKHFPDKTFLMAAVMDHWLADRPSVSLEAEDLTAFWTSLNNTWWTGEHMAMYRLVIAEGWRFDLAAGRFWQQFDQPWQAAATEWLTAHEPHSADYHLDHIAATLWQRLRRHS